MDLQIAVPSVLLTIMYALSGLEKFTKLEKVAEGLAKRTFGATFPVWVYVLVLVVSSSMLILASGTVVYAAFTGTGTGTGTGTDTVAIKKWGSYAALYLAAFTVAATLVYHWPPTGKTYYPFISNVTAIGGLLLLAKVLSV